MPIRWARSELSRRLSLKRLKSSSMKRQRKKFINIEYRK